MSGRRVEGGLIDRSRPLRFTFDGRAHQGVQGDTIASALLGGGVRVVGRSFKYHRPRGIWGAWVDEPNAVFSVRKAGSTLPNVPGATTPLEDGMEVRAVNAWPSARRDVKSVLDLFHRWLGAGFYYKTFIWPDWRLFEPAIRRMAGLGAVGPDLIEGFVSEQRHETADVLVIGGGAAGLAAARAAAESGRQAWLVDDHPELGGGLHRRGAVVEGEAAADWIRAQEAAIRAAGGRVLTRTTAFGAYDHGMVGLAQEHGFARAPTLWRVRARAVIVATGAIDRPVTFAGNDLPGVMSLEAATEYLGRYGVLVGERIAVAANHSLAGLAGDRLREAGAEIVRLDPAAGAMTARGRGRVDAVEQGGRRIEADTVLASTGWTPLVHLWRHAGGRLRWDEEIAAFVPDGAPGGMTAVGAAAGVFDLEQALAQARAAAVGQAFAAGPRAFRLTPVPPGPSGGGRQWIDLQNDVTLKDVEIAARENFVSVEHLKRFTTLGMATDQGKTSNVPGLAAMAAIRGKSVPEVGATTFRPPFVPVPLELYHGHRRGQLFHPKKRLALESRHREAGAALGEYGGWLRPGWYGPRPGPEAAQAEAAMARATAGIVDASPLGKIEVMGPDAEAFLNFIYYNAVSTLKPGHLRYGFMLSESGVVFDDGILARVDRDRFIVSCSSSHLEAVTRMLESWRQDGNDPDRIFVHDTTSQWATVTVTGPKARGIVASLGLDLDLSPAAFPHMTFREAVWRGARLRIARASFTGDVSYEISTPGGRAVDLWDAVVAAGAAVGAGPIGIEALAILRAEKGFIIVGRDTDGETMPHDLGFGGPRRNKKTPFVGDRSLHGDCASDPDRRMLVGLAVPQGHPRLPTGGHVVEGGDRPRSVGIVTSSYDSPALNRPIALGLVARGAERHGESVTVWHLGQRLEATIVAPTFFDPQGARLDA